MNTDYLIYGKLHRNNRYFLQSQKDLSNFREKIALASSNRVRRIRLRAFGGGCGQQEKIRIEKAHLPDLGATRELPSLGGGHEEVIIV